MTKKIIIILTLLTFLLINDTCSAQENLNQFDEIKMLEYKISTIEATNEKLLNSIYWTLGTLATIFVGIVALNFFSNISLNKNKLKAIQEEMESYVEEKNNEIKNKIYDKMRKENDKNSDELKKIGDSIKKECEKSTNNITKENISQLNSKIAGHTSKLSDMKKKSLEMEIEILYIKKENYKDKGQVGHFSSMIEILKIAIELDNGWRMEDELDEIKGYLKDGVHENIKVFISELKDVLNNLPDKFNDDKEKIKTLIV